MLHCEKHLINQVHKNVEEIKDLQQKHCRSRDEVESRQLRIETKSRMSSIPQPKPYQIPLFEVPPYPLFVTSTFHET